MSSQPIAVEKFKFVNQNYEIQSERVFGKYSNFFVNILKRFFKRPISVFALLVFFILVLLMIIVPALITGNVNESVSTNSFASNLRPRVPGLGLDGSYWTFLTDAQIKEFEQIPGFIVRKGAANSGVTLALINPYYLPELKNLYPIFGTNSSGVDLWNLVWYGAARSMQVASIVAVSSVLIGMVYGAIAGWFAGKWIDLLLMRIVEIFDSVPTILWILVLVFVFKEPGSSANRVSDTSLISALILVYWTSSAYRTRIYVLKSKDLDFVVAARSLGGSIPRVLFVHMLPTFVGRLLVQFVNLIPSIIFLEATLVFLGVKDTTVPTLGTIVFNGNSESILKPYTLWAPVIIVVCLMLSTKFISIGLNDAVDPRNSTSNSK